MWSGNSLLGLGPLDFPGISWRVVDCDRANRDFHFSVGHRRGGRVSHVELDFTATGS